MQRSSNPAARPGARASRTRRDIPIYVIGGFLGSGKTTLLKRLLSYEIGRGAKPAVVMNEFAETSVDGASLHDHQGPESFEMRELLNGCACCDLSGELTSAVKDLLRQTQGPVFVETTGLADVGQVADVVRAALADVPGKRRGHLASVIAVVDAARVRRAGVSATAREDVRAADTVILNKTDRLRATTVRRLEAEVGIINPHARVFHASFADVVPTDLLVSVPHQPPATTEQPRSSTDGYNSVTARLLGPVRLDRLERLLTKHARRLARVKGFVGTTTDSRVQALQWLPGSLQLSPRPGRRGLRPHLVMVGKNIDWESLVDELDRCVSMPRATRRGSGRI